VLLIDDKGGIVGEMEAEAQLGELDGKEKGPVILDVEAGVQPGNTVKVTEVPADEMDDWLLSGASRLSCVVHSSFSPLPRGCTPCAHESLGLGC
jgi:hypothetical protein